MEAVSTISFNFMYFSEFNIFKEMYTAKQSTKKLVLHCKTYYNYSQENHAGGINNAKENICF